MVQHTVRPEFERFESVCTNASAVLASANSVDEQDVRAALNQKNRTIGCDRVCDRVCVHLIRKLVRRRIKQKVE